MKQDYFFTSDIHFGHANILKFDNRPWTNIEDHDKDIIDRWNKQVGPNDIVWYLGDFGLRNASSYLEEVMKKLTGKIHFVPGNHDNKNILKLYDKYGILEPPLTEWKHPETGQRVVMCHYAMRVWNQSHHGAWMLYGHSHGSLPEDPNAFSFDVGINTNHFNLYTWDEVSKKMKQKNYKPVDHHGSTSQHKRAS